MTRGRSRGRVQGVRTPPPRDDLRFSNTTGILPKKKTMWLIGVEVEQETSAPPPKKKSWIRPCWPHLAVVRSLQNRRYFFAFYRRAKASAKRLRSAIVTRHARGKHFPVARVCCSSRASFALAPGLRSPKKRGKITPVLQANYFVTLKV